MLVQQVRFGNKLANLNVTEVSYKGDEHFNLFAVGRCLIDGWKLGRDTNHVAVSKDSV